MTREKEKPISAFNLGGLAIWPRIDRLRVHEGLTLAQIAEALGVGISMLMMVKTGKRNLSAKAIYRLEKAERLAGESPKLQIQYCAELMEQCASESVDWTSVSITELHDLRRRLIAIGHAAKKIRRERCGEQIGAQS